MALELGILQRVEDLETHHRKRLYFLEHTVRRTMSANNLLLRTQKEERNIVEKTSILKKAMLRHRGQTVGRNKMFQGTTGGG